MSTRLVAARTMTPSLAEKPSISTKKLVQGLLTLVMTAAQAGAALAAHGVDLIDKDDGGESFWLGQRDRGPGRRPRPHRAPQSPNPRWRGKLTPASPPRRGPAGSCQCPEGHQQHALGDTGPQGHKPLGSRRNSTISRSSSFPHPRRPHYRRSLLSPWSARVRSARPKRAVLSPPPPAPFWRRNIKYHIKPKMTKMAR